MDSWITKLIEELGYSGIALLMFLENIFPPIPSELIMPLAGFTASKGDLNLALVMVAGTAGTIAGAVFWYLIARQLGEKRLRRLADRHGRWLTLKGEDIDRLDDWFCRHDRWAVPAAHAIPGLRTLISIPAGIFSMRPIRFLLLTMLGASLWNGALSGAGYLLGERFQTIERYLGPVSTAIMAAIIFYYVWRVVRFEKRG